MHPSTLRRRAARAPLARAAALATLAASVPVARAAAQTTDSARIAAAVDSIAAAALAGGKAAGMSIAVSHGGRPVVTRGYGMADVEWRVPTPAGAVYEIGSVTKQLTGAAIMRLVEQGKVDLDAEVTTYLPAFDPQGRRITVRRLLDHTSGIRPYTAMPEFRDIERKSLPRDTMVRLLSKATPTFEPGAAEAYNNSGFFLAGLLVEKVSGKPYAEFVKEELFDRAGMRDSRYCDQGAVVPHRARGYELHGSELRRGGWIDHTWPFAAGSICSTVADLDAWNRALHGGRILGAAAYRELVAPGSLADGTPLSYAKGIATSDLAGRRALHHGGAIPGFLSYVAWFPETRLSVAVLVNTMGPVQPLDVVRAIAEVVHGKAAPRVARLDGKPSDYAGEYRGVGGYGEELVMRVTVDSTGGLVLAGPVAGPTPRPLTSLGNGVFEVDDKRLTFVRDAGRVSKMRLDVTYALLVLKRD